MYKILLADDEGIAIDSLRYIISQNFSDTCDIRIAQSSRQVFDIFRKYDPDITFLNVQMTGIHGIYSIRELHAIHKNCIYIVISHSKKTNYNREGDYMRITEYLKKPVSRENAIRALSKAIQQVDHERNLVMRKQLNKEKLETVIPIIENGFITEILFRKESSENLHYYKELLNISGDYGWVMSLDFCESEENGAMVNPIGAMVQLQKQISLFRTIIKAFFPGAIIGPALANRVVVFVPCRTEVMTQKDTEFYQDRAQRMMVQLKRKLNLYFKLGIGNVHPISQISISLQEARR